jgi:aldose 1-epimerase
MELVSEIQYWNPDDRPLPCGFATHAYFRLPLSKEGTVADTIVTVPVAAFWELEQMIPTGRILPVPHHERMQGGLRLDEHKFDTVFTRLHSAKNGRIQTCLADPASGRTLAQSFDPAFTQCVVYTPPHRQAICLEPYTCVPDAIRLAADGHETGLQILQPGEEFSTIIRLQLT